MVGLGTLGDGRIKDEDEVSKRTWAAHHERRARGGNLMCSCPCLHVHVFHSSFRSMPHLLRCKRRPSHPRSHPIIVSVLIHVEQSSCSHIAHRTSPGPQPYSFSRCSYTRRNRDMKGGRALNNSKDRVRWPRTWTCVRSQHVFHLLCSVSFVIGPYMSHV